MLRITSDLRHYALGAKDGHTGSVEDFYFDDEEWIISYVVAGTDTWLEDRLRILSLMTGPGRFTTSSSTPGIGGTAKR